MSPNIALIALVLFALVCLLIGGRRKVAPMLVGFAVCAVLAYFALASLGYSPAAVAELFSR